MTRKSLGPGQPRARGTTADRPAFPPAGLKTPAPGLQPKVAPQAGPPRHIPPVYRPQQGRWAATQPKMQPPAVYRPSGLRPVAAPLRYGMRPQFAKGMIQRSDSGAGAAAAIPLAGAAHAPVTAAVTFREETISCRYFSSDGSYAWLAKFILGAAGDQSGLIIQHVVREFEPAGSAKMTQTFYEAWETDFDGGDVTTGTSVFNRSTPMDNFAGSLPWTGSATLTGTLYFVPASHSQYAAIKASFKKGTPGVPKEITMPTALVVNGSLGNAVGHRVLKFVYDKKARKATLTVTAGGQAVKAQEID